MLGAATISLLDKIQMNDGKFDAVFFRSGQTLGPQAGAPIVKLEMPAIPDPVRVSLIAKSTALLISDMTRGMQKKHPARMASIEPNVAAMLAAARSAKVFSVFSCHADNAPDWLDGMSPFADDSFVAARGQDRFFQSDLDEGLKARGIETVILTGWKVNGSLLYTAIGATLRRYTTIIPVDATSAPADFEIALGLHQMLNQYHPNAANESGRAGAVTLSLAQMVSFA